MPELTSLLQNIQNLLAGVGGTVFVICVVVAAIMRMISFGSERRIAISNIAITAAIVGLVILLLSFAFFTFITNIIKSGPVVTPPTK